MDYAKYITALLLMFTGIFVTNAQYKNYSTDDKKAIKLYKIAEQSFILGDSEVAIVQLNKAIKREDTFAEAWLLLGDINTELSNYAEAVENYKKALQISNYDFYFANYLIGNLEFTMGNYKSALNFYNHFLLSEGLSDIEEKNIKLKIENTKAAIKLQNNPLDILLTNIDSPINTISDEYINFVDEEMVKLYMTRKERNPDYEIDGNPFSENFYYITFSDEKWDTLAPFDIPVHRSFNTGAMSFSIDRKQLYFTGCSWPDSYGSCDLYHCIKYGQDWQNAGNLGTTINSTSWDSQPILSSDGKTLYFASKRSGGYGGSDIWESEKQENGMWGKPKNLGDSINTPGNEMAPYIHADTKTFYFASDGHAGLGGYDLFISRINEDGSWAKADNLGVPVNSKDNEINIFISIDACKAWISSDRDNGFGGFDIYEFRTEPSIKPNTVVYVKGTVYNFQDKQALSAVVKLTNIDKNIPVIETQTDPVDGSFFVPIYPGTNYAFNIASPGYLFYSENFNFRDSLKFRSVEKSFGLTPLQQGSSMVLNNIFFDFDSDSLKSTSYTELDLLAEFLQENPYLKISINGHTDSIGNAVYNYDLSEKRAKAVFQFLVDNQIQPGRLQYKGLGASRPVASNETEEGRAINRRTEIVIL
jgi:outer membrane protein OmpA-like peptidoglycan-associated protein/tetratricopeptide (TPR) repeat protein